ncbi:hypothetical protein ACFLV7_15555 [Chloroflexota bacterium]
MIVLDAGNSVIIAKIARKEHGEVSFSLALNQLAETEYKIILSRSKNIGLSREYMLINEQLNAIGEGTEQHGVQTQRTGSARYTRDYFGVFATVVLGMLFDRWREISIFGIHPLSDSKLSTNLMETLIGDWHVEIDGRNRHFWVTYANTFEEQVVGLMKVY